MNRTDRQYNCQKKKDENKNNYSQKNSTQKTKNWTTRTPLKSTGEPRCSGSVSSSWSTIKISRVTIKRHAIVWKSCWTQMEVKKNIPVIIILQFKTILPNTYMLSGCELIDTENISLPSRNMKLGGDWAKRTSHKLHILSSRLIFFSINHIHIQMTCLSSLNQNGYIYICIFAGKITWFKIFKIRFPKRQFTSSLQIYHSFLQVYIIVKIVEFFL